MNVIELAQSLIRCPSVTPEEGGALTFLEMVLKPLGFRCHRLRFEEKGTEPVENLYAEWGEDGPNLCFAGHTDVVPPGDTRKWSVDPFAAEIRDGWLIGRGAEDMKGAIAAFVAAAAEIIQSKKTPQGRISLLITGDEEGPAINGTRKVLEWMKVEKIDIDACIVGEPTNPSFIGEMAKIGRRGSVTFTLTVKGRQGHVAYPQLADNPVPRLIRTLFQLTHFQLDEGTSFFQPSNLEVTTIDVGNPATNVIPGEARAVFNIRFNDRFTSEMLREWVAMVCDTQAGEHVLEHRVTGEAFLTKPGGFSDCVIRAVHEVTGHLPELSTTGGTSDARFIKGVCSAIVEFGTTGLTAHQVDEKVKVKDLATLQKIYAGVIRQFLK